MNQTELVTKLSVLCHWALEQTFEGEDIDGGDFQSKAVELGLAHFEPFDPEVHTSHEGDGIEEGMPWLVVDAWAEKSGA